MKVLLLLLCLFPGVVLSQDDFYRGLNKILPTALKVNVDAFALCLSARNDTAAEKRTVDALAKWSCAHYTQSYTITNHTYESGKRLDEDAVIRKHQKKLIQAIRASKRKQIDIYILGHSNQFGIPLTEFLDDMNRDLGRKVRVRFVYNSGCFGLKLDPELQAIAGTYVGHRDFNFGPVYSPMFLIKWFAGSTVAAAVKSSNAFIFRRPFTTSEAANISMFWSSMMEGTAYEDNDPRAYIKGKTKLVF